VNLRAAGDRVEELLGELRAGLDPVAWRKVEETLALVTDLYGGGLRAVVQALRDDENGAPVLVRLVGDELVSSLLVLHGLHPATLAERVQGALAGVRPAGRLSLRLLGSCDGCPSSSATLRHAVERAVAEAAPEIVRLEVEGVASAEPEPVTVPVALGVKAS
jgi:Fe-S cluster biogenesis protein NfuA